MLVGAHFPDGGTQCCIVNKNRREVSFIQRDPGRNMEGITASVRLCLPAKPGIVSVPHCATSRRTSSLKTSQDEAEHNIDRVLPSHRPGKPHLAVDQLTDPSTRRFAPVDKLFREMTKTSTHISGNIMLKGCRYILSRSLGPGQPHWHGIMLAIRSHAGRAHVLSQQKTPAMHTRTYRVINPHMAPDRLPVLIRTCTIPSFLGPSVPLKKNRVIKVREDGAQVRPSRSEVGLVACQMLQKNGFAGRRVGRHGELEQGFVGLSVGSSDERRVGIEIPVDLFPPL